MTSRLKKILDKRYVTLEEFDDANEGRFKTEDYIFERLDEIEDSIDKKIEDSSNYIFDELNDVKDCITECVDNLSTDITSIQTKLAERDKKIEDLEKDNKDLHSMFNYIKVGLGVFIILAMVAILHIYW